MIHTWKPVTQLRVRQGLDGVRSLLPEERTGWRPRSRSNRMDYDSETNRAMPTLRIDAGPRIQVKPSGAKVSQSKLRRLVPIFEEHAVDHDLLVEGARNLRDYFQSQGYFEAQVEFKQQNVINDKANVDFLVNHGQAPQAGGHQDHRQPLLLHRRDPRAHVPANRQSAAVSPRPLQRKPAARATEDTSRTFTSPTDFATSR